MILFFGLLGRLAVLGTQHAGGLSSITTGAMDDVLHTRAGWSIALAAVLNLTVAAGISRIRGGRYAGYVAAGSALIAVALGGHGGRRIGGRLPLPTHSFTCTRCRCGSVG